MTASTPSAASAPLPVIASAWIRLIAVVYDGMLILGLLFFVSMALIVAGTHLLVPNQMAHQAIATLPAWFRYGVQLPATLLTIWWFYGVFLKRTGQTLGMQTWRLKTVLANGQLLGWQHTFWRCLSASVLPVACGLMSQMVYGSLPALALSFGMGFLLNYLFALANKRGLAIHDLLSGSVTVRLPVDPNQSFWKRS